MWFVDCCLLLESNEGLSQDQINLIIVGLMTLVAVAMILFAVITIVALIRRRPTTRHATGMILSHRRTYVKTTDVFFRFLLKNCSCSIRKLFLVPVRVHLPEKAAPSEYIISLLKTTNSVRNVPLHFLMNTSLTIKFHM